MKGWKKGALMGALIAILLLAIIFISEPPYKGHFLEILVLYTIMYFIPIIVFGTIIGFLSSKFKNKLIFVGGIVGLIIGVFSFILFASETKVGYIFLYILGYILNAIFPLDNLGPGREALAPFFVLFNFIMWIIIGVLVAIMINYLKRNTLTKSIGLIMMVIGFIIIALTYKLVYLSTGLYTELYIPYIHILGIMMAISGIYYLIKHKIKPNSFFVASKLNIFFTLSLFIIFSIVVIKIASYGPPGTAYCLAIGCEPIFNASKILASLSLPLVILSYLISSSIIFIEKIVKNTKKSEK